MKPIQLNLPGSNDFFTEEAYKVLRTNLQFCGKDVKVIALTSCNANEGKSTVSLHIAKSFSELGKKVLLIDADMRKSVIAGRNTTVTNPRGLSEVLTGLNTLEECIYPVEDASLHILFAGKYPPNPVELLNSKYFEELMKKSRESYDYIIVDTPPLGQVIDAAVIAKQCDGVAMIISNSKVHYKTAQTVVDIIQKSGCKMLGVIRNSSKRQKGGYYYRKYGYASKYGYAAAPLNSKKENN